MWWSKFSGYSINTFWVNFQVRTMQKSCEPAISVGALFLSLPAIHPVILKDAYIGMNGQNLPWLTHTWRLQRQMTVTVGKMCQSGEQLWSSCCFFERWFAVELGRKTVVMRCCASTCDDTHEGATSMQTYIRNKRGQWCMFTRRQCVFPFISCVCCREAAWFMSEMASKNWLLLYWFVRMIS